MRRILPIEYRRDIAFDVDGTLIRKTSTNLDIPRYEIIQILFSLYELGHEIYVWSGSGVDYADRWTEKLGLEEMVTVIAKGSRAMDICFDDELCELGKVNIAV